MEMAVYPGMPVHIKKGKSYVAKYVFLNMPAHGHVNPTLPLVQELVERGQQVSYYLTEEFRAAVEATGATFQPYQSQLQGQGAPDPTNVGGGPPIARLGAMMMEETRSVPLQVTERIRAEKPDVIVYDFMCAWAIAVVDELKIPAVATRATYASNEHFSVFAQMRKNMEQNPAAQQFMGRMGGQMGGFFQVFSRVEQLNIVFIPKEFQPAADTFDERYVFVGPPILPRHQETAFPFERLNSNLPLLYISLGSVFTNQIAFYRLCFEAFAGQPWQVVLSIGRQTDPAQLGATPENFLLAPYVPQLEILPKTQVFVTHAGTNSVMESLYYGVPMVLIPQQPEQHMHATRVAELGAGLLLEKERLTPSTLRETVTRIANDGAYRTHAQHMQQVTRAAGGQQRAADAIMQFTETQLQRTTENK